MVSRSKKANRKGPSSAILQQQKQSHTSIRGDGANMGHVKLITHRIADGGLVEATGAGAASGVAATDALSTSAGSATSAASESMNTNLALADYTCASKRKNGTRSDDNGVPPLKVVETLQLYTCDSEEGPLSLDVLLDMDYERVQLVPPKSSCCKRMGKYTIVTLLVWYFQVVLAVSLKRYGYIEQDLNQLLAQHIVPQLQQQLEQTLLGFNESSPAWYLQRFMNESISMGSISMGYIMQERQRPGFQLAQEGAHGQYPVFMIPGFVTSGLEVWSGKECTRNYFRQRMWGGIGGAKLALLERDCVLKHLKLDPLTGADPEGIRLRAAQGFEAADYFMANYWVWGKILENLADMGYDASSMSMESYDWRLAFPILEQRDGYLTKLRYKIEAFHKTSGKKVIISSHSLGAILVHYFFAWVTTSEEEGGGGGGSDWVDQHVHAYVNIAGAHLGVPKAATALFSGEMSDTIFMGTAGTLVEQFLGKRLRRDLWSTWGSLWAMLPKGGDALWNVGGDIYQGGIDRERKEDTINLSTSSENDPELPLVNGDDGSVSPFITMTDMKDETMPAQETTNEMKEPVCTNDEEPIENQVKTNEVVKSFFSRQTHSTTEMIDFLLQWGSGFGPSLASTKHHSFDHEEEPSSKTWHDVSRTPLPYAPNMKIYCLYGVGLDTERSYYYKRNADPGDKKPNSSNSVEGGESSSRASPINHFAGDPSFVIDTSVEDPDHKVVHGVQYVDGDRSVPLLSLGYMCADAWKRPETGLNPSGIEVITREYQHKEEFVVDDPMRRGPLSADHVDILGNARMMEDFMKIVSDHHLDEVGTNIISDIENIAKRINEHPRGGLKKMTETRQTTQPRLFQQRSKKAENKKKPFKKRRLWPFGRR